MIPPSISARTRTVCAHGLLTSLALFMFASLALPRASSAQGTSTIDSLVNTLNAPDWPTRSRALSAVRDMQPPLPPALVSPIVALVKREAGNPAFGAGSHDYGEYVIDLVLAAVKTGDKSTIPALIALGGVGISSGVSAFIASGGPSILPVLDSVQRASPNEADALLETVALMYSKQGALLSSSDSAALLSRLIAAASSPAFTARMELPFLALRVPLPDFVPLLRILAASDTFQEPAGVFPVRRAAQLAVDTLAVKWTALSTSDLLALLKREQAGSCASVSGALHGHCQSMSADLDDVSRQIAKSNSQPALSAISNFRKALQQAAGAGLAALTVQLMDGNAARLAQLLGG